MILFIRTDAPGAMVGLIGEDGTVRAAEEWHAHRELSDTILLKIKLLLSNCSVTLGDLKGIVVFKGPGSFTGLRIGITIANTLAYAESIAVVGTVGESWREEGAKRLMHGDDDRIVLPAYGSEAHISTPRK